METSLGMGKRIREKRLALGLTQEKLACQLQVSEVHISKIERGKAYPSFELLVKLMDTLNMTPNELFWGQVETTKPELVNETASLLNQFPNNQILLINDLLALHLKELKEENDEERSHNAVNRQQF